MKKTKNKNKLIKILSSICLVLLIIIIIIIISLVNRKESKSNNELIGKWTTDGVTIYEFKKDNTGFLIVPLSEYKFNYKIEGKKLLIDFENEKSIDSKYTYSIKNGKLILKGSNGNFTFKKA